MCMYVYIHIYIYISVYIYIIKYGYENGRPGLEAARGRLGRWARSDGLCHIWAQRDGVEALASSSSGSAQRLVLTRRDLSPLVRECARAGVVRWNLLAWPRGMTRG